MKASFDDKITVNGKIIKKETLYYYMFHKPKWTLTTLRDDRNRPTVMDTFKELNTYLFPIGRLDFDTTGLLLITNDGVLSQYLTSPRNKIMKTYEILIRGIAEEKKLEELKDGIQLTNYHTAPIAARVKNINIEKDYSVLEIKIYEGKKHEIKDIIIYLDYELLKLKRVSINGISLDSKLEPGEYRKLTELEIKKLYN